MDAISESEARDHLDEVIDRVSRDRTALLITRHGEGSAVLLPLEDYRALEETLYLSRSPANAARLSWSIDALESGQGHERDLSE